MPVSPVGSVALGGVIPAHPLAVSEAGTVDFDSQRMLTRYYIAAGAHGMAVGVHTTQFELHSDRALLSDVWTLAAEEASNSGRNLVLVAGLCGDVEDAVAEAEIAAATGYGAALLCPYGMSERTEEALLTRARAVGEILPTIGFYLQDSVGGLRLSRDYWRRLFDLPSTVGVKTAPFDRYRTNDVLQVLLEHDRWDEITVLTGNDDAIVHDLITPYRKVVAGQPREVRAAGGLLGQWAVGARAAVELFDRIADASSVGSVSTELLRAASDLVNVNAAVFDVDNDFVGCVAGVNEVLRQQGLVRSMRCLGNRERLSKGQSERIRSVREQHADLLDEEFIAANVDTWRR